MLAPDARSDAALLPYAYPGVEGCSGRLKAQPEDFQVDEVPLYEPGGVGEHLYLWIEKRGRSTAAVSLELQECLAVNAQAIGTAGQKDTEAITRQWISVHTPEDPDPARLQGDGWRTLQASRHSNKLRAGHSAGNRFRVRIRNAQPSPDVDAILAKIVAGGFPNYFGTQRLGEAHRNAAAGQEIIRSGRVPRGSPQRTRFAVNAYQAALFNRLLAQRLWALGTLGSMRAGDLAVLHRNGASFGVSEADLVEVQARAEAHELSPSAPLYGYRVSLAAGVPGQWELDLLHREGLSLESFRLGSQKHSPKGERRAIRAFANELAWDWSTDHGEAHLYLGFTLRPGVYATSLLRELMRNDGLSEFPMPSGQGEHRR